MTYYFQSATGIYFLQDGEDVYSCVEGKKAKKEGKHILKNAFPKPKEIDSADVPDKVRAAFKTKMESTQREKASTRRKSMTKITEDFRIPGTDILLEEGDVVKVLLERRDSVRSLRPGDLVFLPDEGSSGLVGLVTTKAFSDPMDNADIVNVTIRGYGGDNIHMSDDHNFTVIDQSTPSLIDLAMNKGDIRHYTSIARKKGIPFDADEYYVGEDTSNSSMTITEASVDYVAATQQLINRTGTDAPPIARSDIQLFFKWLDDLFYIKQELGYARGDALIWFDPTSVRKARNIWDYKLMIASTDGAGSQGGYASAIQMTQFIDHGVEWKASQSFSVYKL